MKLEKWLKNNNLTVGGYLDLEGTQIKEKYTVKEIIKITEGVYGSKEFKDFFVGDFVNNNFC